MLLNTQLFAYLAIAVAIVGTYLWLKPRPRTNKLSGVGDQGQRSRH